MNCSSKYIALPLVAIALLMVVSLACRPTGLLPSGGGQSQPTQLPAPQATAPGGQPVPAGKPSATPAGKPTTPTTGPASQFAKPDLLDSYRARMKMGTQKKNGSKSGEMNWTMEWVKEPTSRHIVMGGDMQVITIKDTTWVKVGGKWMQQTAAQRNTSQTPDSLLPQEDITVKQVGEETVNGVHCKRYTISGKVNFTIPAMQGQPERKTSVPVQGEVWVADQSGLPEVPIRQRMEMEASLMGLFTGAPPTEGEKTYFEAELYDINTPITIQPPGGPTPPAAPTPKPTTAPAPTPGAQQPPAPAGKRIAFVSNRDDNNEIYVMNVDGSDPINLTKNPDNDVMPAWSPDGKRLVFVSDRGDGPVFFMNADGSGVTALVGPEGGNERALAWSLDGKWLAFASDHNSDPELYVINIDGSGLIQLTENDHDTFDENPSWSPDGKRIAFDSNREDANQIYVTLAPHASAGVNPDGSDVIRLTETGDDWEPAWSPDGKRIAFHSNRDGNEEIYVMNADGSGQTRLTKNEVGDTSPAWSPDGKRIAFVSERDGNLEIYVMNADGSGQTRLTNNDADDIEPAWQP